MTTITWNVYKIFANGKRAKFPIKSFEYSNEDQVFEYFENEIRASFTEKQKKSSYTLIRSDLPQQRKENSISSEEVLSQKRAKVLKKHLEALDKTPIVNTNANFGLLLAPETNFQWQWTAIEAGTGRYLVGISPIFANHADAIDWMDTQI